MFGLRLNLYIIKKTFFYFGILKKISTFALNNATIAHAIALAEKGWKNAMIDDMHLRNGLNVCKGKITYEAVANALGYVAIAPETCLQ